MFRMEDLVFHMRLLANTVQLRSHVVQHLGPQILLVMAGLFNLLSRAMRLL
jgi:hypothetical protein